jgi:glucose/arabinose dehydrogenase
VTRLACLFALLPALAIAADPPKPTVVAKDLHTPWGVCVTPDGRTFVTVTFGVAELKDGKEVRFFDTSSPTAVVAYQKWLFVCAGSGVHRIDLSSGEAEVWVEAAHFPDQITGTHGLAVDERGVLYVSTSRPADKEPAIYSVGVKPGARGKPPVRGDVRLVADKNTGLPWVQFGLVCDGMNHLLAVTSRDKLVDGSVEEVAGEVPATSSLCMDQFGRLFAVGTSNTVLGLPAGGSKWVTVAKHPFHVSHGGSIAVDPKTGRLLFPDLNTSSLLSIPAQIPGWEVDETPLAVEAVPAFADVKWTGWDDGSSTGKVNPLRPLVLTHANDGSGRTFVATQHGVIHAIDKGAKESKVFLDIQNKVLYKDNENEQGLLGLAFHPDFKKTGEFYAFYTDKAKKLENVLSRFKVSKDDPTKADPASEQELLRVSHKYWNHDGGTLAFGPDGYLYVVLGDGGSANDPDDHGQKNDVLLGKILRIDINAKGDTTPYAIPKDNPFVGKKDYRPEIFATGVRNPWRMSFDRKTGQGWFGDVGQNLWEEIDLLEKGANYGWRRREGMHPFGADGSGPKKELTDPIWEYSHEVGKSITGGHVYRGKAVPALEGHYLYADYVSAKVWALKYDEKGKRVTANRPVSAAKQAWMSFGEDEAGEVYIMTYSATGKGIYTFKAGR